MNFSLGGKDHVEKPKPIVSSELMAESRTPYFIQMNRVKENSFIPYSLRLTRSSNCNRGSLALISRTFSEMPKRINE